MRGVWIVGFLLLGGFAYGIDSKEASEPPKRILVIAGKKSHGPDGNGIHDYVWSAKLVKVMLDHSNVRDRVNVEVATNGWPTDPSSIEKADSIMILSDGRDGDLYEEAPHLSSPEHIEAISRQVRRGCGLVTFHFSTFAPDRYAEQILDWVGGYFDWETDGKRQWYSAIQVADTNVELADPAHPASRGVRPFQLKEEFYFNLRFHPVVGGMTPLLRVPALPGRDHEGKVVAWARQRVAGGRGFGTTCGHFYENWKNHDFRKLILNGLVWSAGIEPPAEGVDARYYDRSEIESALDEVSGTERSQVDEEPIRVLLFAGNQPHEWHNWKKTTPAIQSLLEKDPRIKVEISHDIEELGRKRLKDYGALLLNYCNWQDPAALSEASRRGLVEYLQGGGGLVVVHFANGAFHYSLPNAGGSDWPEYRRIVRRVWDHQGKGESQSGHDAFGPFEVQVTSVNHPVTKGLGSFRVIDELYFRQAGDDPIEPLIVARSAVTQRDEPLAFTYRYGEGRVFQTLLGHSEKTYDSFGAREMLRRAVAFVAGRPVYVRSKDFDPDPVRPAAPRGAAITEGRFGTGLDARVASGVLLKFPAAPVGPITAELWTRLESAQGYNILLAHHPKGSVHHWEVFTEPGTGNVVLYAPGMNPDHVRTAVSITDRQWHHLALSIEAKRVRIVIDGKQAASDSVVDGPVSRVVGALGIGGLVEGSLGCDGMLDEVRVRRGTSIEEQLPSGRPTIDGETVALWRFDRLVGEKQIADESSNKHHLELRDPVAVTEVKTPPADPHFEEGSVGFRWREEDSADGRWNDADVGPFLASVVGVREGFTLARGLTISLAKDRSASILYDLQSMSWIAGWTGGFLRFNPFRHGLIMPPTIGGERFFEGDSPSSSTVRYRGLHRAGDRIILESRVDGVRVLEEPLAVHLNEPDKVQDESSVVFIRSIEVEPGSSSIRVPIVRGEAVRVRDDGLLAECLSRVLGVTGEGKLVIDQEKTLAVEIPASPSIRRVRVGIGRTPGELNQALLSKPTDSLAEALSRRTTSTEQTVVTRIVPSKSDASYVVDDLPLPTKNPHRSLCFPSGHDFLPNGDLAVCMVHGDVWIASGVSQPFGDIRWRRWASGLHQPLDLKVFRGSIYVLGRDQITRLHDHNKDGEVDEYENFFSDYETSPDGHDYNTCLETDAEGNFYFLSATQGLMKIRADRSGTDVVASGLRNPNGMGIGPDGSILAAPQEGNWTPSSSVVRIKNGGFYGYRPMEPSKQRGPYPDRIDPPMCWIPRLLDNSGGSQTWIDSPSWGPLSHHWVHYSYGQCRVLLLMTEQVGQTWQGGVVTLPLEFRSGVMRGRINPSDGQLYVSGLKGWVSSAVDDGVLSRIRYTGKRLTFPSSVETFRQGLLIRFTDRVDPNIAGDADRYSASAWNYQYRPEYGSPDIHPRDPKREGREEWEISSATVMDDGRAVFLEIPALIPVMQLVIEMKIESDDHQPLETTLAYTIHEIPDRAIPEEQIVRRAKPGDLPSEIEGRLEQGMVFEVTRNDEKDVAFMRAWAWSVPAGTSLAEGVSTGDFRAQSAGYLKVPRAGEYKFTFEGTGRGRIQFHDRPADSLEELETSPTISVRLHKGYNRFAFDYQSPVEGESRLRVRWESDSFSPEPVIATSLYFDATDPRVVAGKERIWGGGLVREHRCLHCHQGGDELRRDGPDLVGVGSRIQSDWLVDWLADPKGKREQATMPALFDLSKPSDRQSLSDVAAYLASLQVEDAKENSLATTKEPSPDERSGSKLYEGLNCFACHTLEKKDPLDAGRLSLTGIQQKYTSSSLDKYLLDPSKHYPATPMPSFRLSLQEGADLRAFLFASLLVIETKQRNEEGSIARGEKEYATRGCQQCHQVDESKKTQPAHLPSFSLDHGLERGCLSRTSQPGVPTFGFSDAEREAIASYWKSTFGRKRSTANLVETTHQMHRLRCQACHSRDGQASRRLELHQEESESGLPPEPIPDLTWASEKLREEYVRSLLGGEERSRARPWLFARMPSFGHAASTLATSWSAEMGLLETGANDDSKPVDADMVAIGEKLTGLSSGLDCRQCHAMGQQQPAGDDRTQLALGINFGLLKHRLRPEHYLRFVLDPARFDVSTRMPKLSMDGRTTKIRDVLEGDARRQFQAIWEFIQTVPEPASP